MFLSPPPPLSLALSLSLCPFFSLILLVWGLLVFSLGLTHLSLSAWVTLPPTPLLLQQDLLNQTLLPNGITIDTVIKIRGVVPCRAGR